MKNNKKCAQMLFANNKYLVLSKSQSIYQDIRNYLKSDNICVEVVQNYINKALSLEEDRGQFINSFQHMWGYFKKNVTPEEKQYYLEYMDAYKKHNLESIHLLCFLYRLLKKYPNEYLLNSTIFDRVKT